MMYCKKKCISWLLIAIFVFSSALPGTALALENTGSTMGSSDWSEGTEGEPSAQPGEEPAPEPAPSENEQDEESKDRAEDGNTSAPAETDPPEGTADEQEPETEAPAPETAPAFAPEEFPALFSDSAIAVNSWNELQTAIDNAESGVETVITITGDFEATSQITIPASKQITLEWSAEYALLNKDVVISSNAGTTRIGFVLTGTDVKLEFKGVALQGTVGIVVNQNAKAEIIGLKSSGYEIAGGTADTARVVDIGEKASVSLSSCEFSDNIASDIRAVSSADIRITHGRFTNTYYNAIRCNAIGSLTLDDVHVTGGKTVSAVSVTSSLNIGTALTITDSSFNNNTVTGTQAAVHTYNMGDVKLDNVEFIDNISTANSGTVRGGAYYQRSGTLLMTNCTFESNKIINATAAYGGAAYLEHINDAKIQSCTFKDNHARIGGAVYSGSGMTASFSDVKFIENSALNHLGGALYTLAGTTKLEDDVIFERNKANDGGAIYAGNQIIISGSNPESILFDGNTASHEGGAIHCATGGAKLTVNGGLTIRNNSASSWGGGIMIRYGTITFDSKTAPNKIIGNHITGTGTFSSGGAIAISSTSPKVTLGGKLEISGNSAQSGGAIYVRSNHNFSIDGADVVISGNTAIEDGAGIKTLDSTIKLSGLSITDNHAGTNGGGLSVTTGLVTLENAQVMGNIADSYGGGIYINGNGTLSGNSKLTNLLIDNNEALNGGGLAVYGESRVAASGLTITDNKAYNNGGGVSISREALTTCSITDTAFADNIARACVNVLSLADYEDFKQMVEGGIIESVTGTSLDDSTPMYYLDTDAELKNISGVYRAYNNLDFAYHEVIYQLKYDLHGGTDANNSFKDDNLYGAGVRLSTSPGADKILIHLINESFDPPVGMEFAGWSQSLLDELLVSENGLYYIVLALIDGNTIHLHARYAPKKFTVTFYANGGSFDMQGNPSELTATVEYGNGVTADDDPSELLIPPTDLHFAGWYTASSGGALADLSSITGDTEVYAQWLPFDPQSQFEVVYYLDEDSDDIYYREFYPFGQSIIKGVGYADPSRRGHEFSHWYEHDEQEEFDFTYAVSNPNDGSIVTLYLYASWEPVKYTLEIINSDESDTYIDVADDRIDEGNTESYLVTVYDEIPIILPEGTHLVEYDYSASASPTLAHFTEITDGYALYNIGSHITLELTVALNQYSVSFFAESIDDTPLAEYSVKYNQTLDDSSNAAPVYGKPSALLTGWRDISDSKVYAPDEVETRPVTDHIVYTGVYDNIYTVALVANNALATMIIDYIDVLQGEPVTLSRLDNTEEQAFLGWARSDTAQTPDFTAREYAFADIFSDPAETYIVLFGVWGPLSTGGGGSSSGGNTARLTVEYRDERGNLIDSVVSTHRVGSRITITAPALSGYTLNDESSKTITIASGNANRITFIYTTNTDEQQYPSLEREQRIPYIEGYPDGTVRPDANLTRGEIATALFRLVTDADKNQPRNHTYSDVPAAMWYHQPIAFFSSYDILTGYPDGTFRPENQITRAEFTAVLSRFGGMQSADVHFTDVPESYWAIEYISNASAQGWITGYPDGSFNPEAFITRAEAITMINRMLERTPDENDFAPSDIAYRDLTSAYWAWLDILEATIGGLK